MTRDIPHITITAQELYDASQRGTLYDFIVGDHGNHADITGPITQTTGFILIETEFRVLRYEPDYELAVGDYPNQN